MPSLTSRPFTIVQAPSPLGVAPHGIEEGCDALLRAELSKRIGAKVGPRIEPAPFDWQRDPVDGMLNRTAISDYAAALGGVVGEVIDAGCLPIVLGGDCSIMLGPLLALQRRGRYGLLFLDGHMDFYQPEAEPRGEAASMELALATGRGPDLVTRIGGTLPLVRDEDIAVLGFRDEEEAFAHGSQALPETILAIGEAEMRRVGWDTAIDTALERLLRPEVEGFWLHLDVDILSDALLPAADFPAPGGLEWEELRPILSAALRTGKVVGLEITIFNARLDPSGEQAERLAEFISEVLSTEGR